MAVPFGKMDAAARRILVALDYPTLELAVPVAERLSGIVGGLKVASTICTQEGAPQVCAAIGRISPNSEIFLDLKYKDIPQQVADAVRAAVRAGATIINLHADGGSKMMKAAAEAAENEAERHGVARPRIIAVTVLTSMGYNDLWESGQVPYLERGQYATLGRLEEARNDVIRQRVLQLARLAKESGMDGVVCSPLEVGLIRENLGQDFLLVVPGIRLPQAETHDQVRIGTPDQAIRDGADFLVVGRDITQAAEPAGIVARYIELVHKGQAERTA